MRKRQSQKATVAPENPVAIDLLEPKPNIAPLSLSQTPTSALFMYQRDDRINGYRPSRRNLAGEQGDYD